MSILLVTGTGTGVGKTVVTAALAAVAQAAGKRTAVVKPAQTGVLPGEPGDCDEVTRLTGLADVHELYRYPAPLAPATAARDAGLPPPSLEDAATHVAALAADHDQVLVEGAGGLLVQLDARGRSLADLARLLGAPVVLVVASGLGTLNHTALTLEALDRRRISLAGAIIGSWPGTPDLAERHNVLDLEGLLRGPLAGALPADAATADPEAFRTIATGSLAPRFGGRFSADEFRAVNAPTDVK